MLAPLKKYKLAKKLRESKDKVFLYDVLLNFGVREFFSSIFCIAVCIYFFSLLEGKMLILEILNP